MLDFGLLLPTLKREKVIFNLKLDNIHDDFGDYCEEKKPNGLIDKLVEGYPAGLSGSFCSDACLCKADKTNFPDKAPYNTMKTSENGASAIVNCPTNPVKDIKKSILSFLGWMEEQWDCSGLCEKENWFYYSDVNRGEPKGPCKDDILDYVDKWYIIGYALIILSAIITFFGAISSLFYTCCGAATEDKQPENRV